MNRFPDHSRIVFIGDSITANGLWIAHIYDFYMRYFPDARIRMYNAGISGGSAQSALRYLPENGLNYNPTHAVIMLGMNDVGRHLYGIPLDMDQEALLTARADAISLYKRRMEELIGTLSARGIHLTLLSPTCFDESQLPGELDTVGCDAALEYMGEIDRKLASKLNADFVNIHAPLRYLNTAAVLTGADRVHPVDAGHGAIARLFLAEQGLVDAPDIRSISQLPSRECLLAANRRRMEAESVIRKLWAVEWLIFRDRRETKVEDRKKYIREYRKNAPSPYFETLCDTYLEFGHSMKSYSEKELAAVEACAAGVR